MLSAQALWAISLLPISLVGLITVACVIGGIWQAHHLPDIASRDMRSPDADVAFWARARRDQVTRRARLGTPEPATPEVARVWLPKATLNEALAYLAEARAQRIRERREFVALMAQFG